MIWSRNRGWIGVDLGTHTVKLAQLEKRAGTIRLAEALIIRRPQPWQVCDEGSQVGPWESRHEIRAALSLGANFHGRNAAVTLPMAVCDMRECQIPAGAEQDQCWEPVAQELKAAWGNTFDQRELGIWAADQPVDRGKSNKNVFAFSIQQTWAARIARDMSQSGLRGQVLDGLPLALGRAVQLGGNCVANEPVVAVDWGYQRASLCAVWNGHPYYVRCLKGGGLIAVVEALCSTLPVTPEEAQQLLTEHGLPNSKLNRCEDLQAAIKEVIAEPVTRFEDELKRTIAFLAQHRRGLSHSRLVLFGGGASIKNVAPFLSDRLEMSVETWRPQDSGFQTGTQPHVPIELMGPAIALSSLGWDRA